MSEKADENSHWELTEDGRAFLNLLGLLPDKTEDKGGE